MKNLAILVWCAIILSFTGWMGWAIAGIGFLFYAGCWLYDEYGEPCYSSDILTDEDLDFYDGDALMACKDGKFPFFFKDDIKFLNLAVGYK